MKFARFADAVKCPYHRRVVEEATHKLEKVNGFIISDVVKTLDMKLLEDAIRWDYVRRIIEEEAERGLIPMALSYFEDHPKYDEYEHPLTYIATGYKKKTYGYIWASLENAHFVRARVLNQKDIAQGWADTAREHAQQALACGVEIEKSFVHTEFGIEQKKRWLNWKPSGETNGN